MRRWSYGILILLSAVVIAVVRYRLERPASPVQHAPTAPAAQHPQATEQPHPRLFVLAINGGGSVERNYLPFLANLQELVDLMRGAGVPGERITVLASDGSDPTPDFTTRADPLGANAWMLDGTRVEEFFPFHDSVFGNSEVRGATLYPATRGSLAVWLMTVGQQLRTGDILFINVTDHGARAAEPDGNRIVLWGDRLSVRELREALETLDPGVRVVALMSQCYSGGFAKLMSLGGTSGEPTGRFCGFFSTTADRVASDSNPQDLGNPKAHHSWAFLQGLLATAGRFSLAHELVLELDQGINVPVRTSDLHLFDVLAGAARDRGVSVAQVADDLLPRAWAQPARFAHHVARLDRLGRRFGLPTLRSLAEVDKAAQFPLKTIGPVEHYAAELDLSMDERNREQFGRFLAAMPEWRASLEPKALRAMDWDGRRQLGAALVSALGAFAGDEGPALVTMQKRDALYALALRMRVHEAALARTRVLLYTVAGLLYLDEHPAERAALQRLLDCESLDLRLAKAEWVQSVEQPPALPQLADESARLRELMGAIAEERLDIQPTLHKGELAPDLQLTPYRGEIPRVGSGRPLLLFFWHRSPKNMSVVPQVLAYASRSDLPVLAIADDDEATLDRVFAGNPPFPASVSRDQGRRTMFRYGVRSLPAFVLLDGEGKLVSPVVHSLQELPVASAP